MTALNVRVSPRLKSDSKNTDGTESNGGMDLPGIGRGVLGVRGRSELREGRGVDGPSMWAAPSRPNSEFFSNLSHSGATARR